MAARSRASTLLRDTPFVHDNVCWARVYETRGEVREDFQQVKLSISERYLRVVSPDDPTAEIVYSQCALSAIREIYWEQENAFYDSEVDFQARILVRRAGKKMENSEVGYHFLVAEGHSLVSDLQSACSRFHNVQLEVYRIPGLPDGESHTYHTFDQACEAAFLQREQKQTQQYSGPLTDQREADPRSLKWDSIYDQMFVRRSDRRSLERCAQCSLKVGKQATFCHGCGAWLGNKRAETEPFERAALHIWREIDAGPEASAAPRGTARRPVLPGVIGENPDPAAVLAEQSVALRALQQRRSEGLAAAQEQLDRLQTMMRRRSVQDDEWERITDLLERSSSGGLSEDVDTVDLENRIIDRANRKREELTRLQLWATMHKRKETARYKERLSKKKYERNDWAALQKRGAQNWSQVIADAWKRRGKEMESGSEEEEWTSDLPTMMCTRDVIASLGAHGQLDEEFQFTLEHVAELLPPGYSPQALLVDEPAGRRDGADSVVSARLSSPQSARFSTGHEPADAAHQPSGLRGAPAPRLSSGPTPRLPSGPTPRLWSGSTEGAAAAAPSPQRRAGSSRGDGPADDRRPAKPSRRSVASTGWSSAAPACASEADEERSEEAAAACAAAAVACWIVTAEQELAAAAAREAAAALARQAALAAAEAARELEEEDADAAPPTPPPPPRTPAASTVDCFTDFCGSDTTCSEQPVCETPPRASLHRLVGGGTPWAGTARRTSSPRAGAERRTSSPWAGTSAASGQPRFQKSASIFQIGRPAHGGDERSHSSSQRRGLRRSESGLGLPFPR